VISNLDLVAVQEIKWVQGWWWASRELYIFSVEMGMLIIRDRLLCTYGD